MRKPPPPPSGDELTLDEYLDDFDPYFWRSNPVGCWKLERRQTFRELANASWEAFEEGDWTRATALLDDGRADVRRYLRKIADQGIEFRRLRVVEKPYSPYLRWELTALMVRHEYGDPIRVASATAMRDTEPTSRLPEIITLGSEVVYQVHYDHTGLANGATRSSDPDTVRAWVEFIRHHYEKAEALPEFFDREIASLLPARSG